MISAYLQLATSMAIVGANVAVLKILSAALPTGAILFLRCTLAALLVLPFAWRDLRWPGTRPAVNLLAQALCGTLAYNLLLLAGLARTSALEAGLVLAAFPATMALGAAIFLGERLRRRQLLATILAAGAMGAVALGKEGGWHGALLGDLLVAGAVVTEACYALLAKANAAHVPPVQATFVMQAASAFAAAPLAALTWDGGGLSAPVALLLVAHAVSASLVAVLLWYRGLRRVGGAVAAVFTGLLPVTAGAVSVLVLGETAGLAQLAAALLMLVSLVLATYPASPGISRSPRHDAAPDRSISASNGATNPSGDSPNPRRA